MGSGGVSIEEVADNGGRARKHGKGDYSAGEGGGSWARTACHVRVARAKPPPPKAADEAEHVDMRFNQKPRVRIEDQDGAPAVAKDETEAAKSAVDAAFELEARIQRELAEEHAAIQDACIRLPSKYVK